MPTYSFQMSARVAGSSVSVTAAGSTDVVASGTLDANSLFTASLPVGDYVATAAGGHYSYKSAGTVAQSDPDQLGDLARTTAGGNRVVFLGDSITAAGGSDPGTGIKTDAFSNGFTTYATLMAGGQAVRVKNAGVGGNTAEMMLARFDTDVTPYAPNVVVLLSGTNDARQAWPLTRYTDAMKALVAKIRRVGALPVLCTIPPTDKTDISTAKRDVSLYNVWLRRYAAEQAIPLVDLTSVLIDPATGNYTAGATADGTHPQDPYFAPMGRQVANVLKAVLPPSSPPMATENTTTANMLTNGLFITQSGTAPTLNPSGWTIAAGVGYTGTFGTDAGVLGQFYRINPNNIGTSSISQTVSTGFTPGDRVLFTGKLRTDGNSAASVFVNFYTGASLTAQAKPADALTDVVDGWGVMACEFTVPAGITSLRVYVQSSNAATAAVDVAQFRLLNLTANGLATS